MSAIKKLIVSAKEALAIEDNLELLKAIEALEALGENARGVSPEYKALKKLMTELKKPKNEAVYNFAGIKQIGSKWYSEKDKYQTGFDDVNECAKHFNCFY